MQETTKTKLIRRLEHLRGVLQNNEGDPEEFELIALFHSVRDMQPVLCQAISEQVETDVHVRNAKTSWAEAFRDPILSDEAMYATGLHIWPDEFGA